MEWIESKTNCEPSPPLTGKPMSPERARVLEKAARFVWDPGNDEALGDLEEAILNLPFHEIRQEAESEFSSHVVFTIAEPT